MNQLANLLHKHFSTNQSYFLAQEKNGTYRKKSGQASARRIQNMLEQNASMAVLQRNIDLSVKWICFDFDIVKSALAGDEFVKAEEELKHCVQMFCQYLDAQNISHLLEFSGNRGFHVWITFNEPLAYWIAYDVQQEILKRASIRFNEKLIALDLFPRSSSPSSGIGSGVKIPLSLHAKSGMYACLLTSSEDIFGEYKKQYLDDSIIQESTSILENHRGLSIESIENIIGKSIDEFSSEELGQSTRISYVKIIKTFGLEDLLRHWRDSPVLCTLANTIHDGKQLSNSERKLLVGLLNRVEAVNGFSYKSLLHEIFQRFDNYDCEITTDAISALSTFYFPSQQQIEDVVGLKFSTDATLSDIINSCIPNYKSHLDENFKISEKDIDVARLAELNYIRTNDEVHAKKVENSLVGASSLNNLYLGALQLLARPDKAAFYIHERQEPNKIRKLVTLEATERVATSAAMKQIINYFDLTQHTNSYGYSVNRGFKGGHIFEPWLMRWIKFTSNIADAISDKEYSEFYIVKSDIRSFYDDIPHDNIKRLLLEGSNLGMKNKLSNLTQEVSEDYKKLINLLFGVTRKITEKSVGLPQGPAYARWLAEIYISSLDEQFDQLLKSDSVQFYQRFVDDIFFIAPNESTAMAVMHKVRLTLDALGLQVNNEKTICKKIKDFTPDFDEYRSQSKYAVDKVSNAFDDATEGEKENAIGEFLKLVQSDTCNDDLSFIFSHLTGVEILDKWKRDKVLPVILSKQGRGSLFRHLFRFAIDDSESCVFLQEVEMFSDLQSEVLTEVLLDYMHEHKSSRDNALNLLENIRSKISLTPLVLEHLAFISLYHGYEVDTKTMLPRHIIEALKHIENASLLQIPMGLVRYVNTELNGIVDKFQFIHVMHCLCATPNINANDLNELSRTFFAKFGYEEINGGLSIAAKGGEPATSSSLSKLHYLICLFSISKAGSVELVKAAWTYCLTLCNEVKVKNFNVYSDDWLRKIELIDIDNSKVLLILSSIVDGNLVRNSDDKLQLFERYHSALLIFFALGENNINLSKINSDLKDLAAKIKFYDWLTSPQDVAIFPNSNKAWFDKNLIENDVILLKKGEELLIRRPTNDFLPSSRPVNEHLGFSELIIPYHVSDLASLKNIMGGLKFNEQLNFLCELIDEGSKRGKYPNFFQQDPMISVISKRSASPEFDSTRKIVFEENGQNVTVTPNDKATFIRSFLQMGRHSKSGVSLLKIENKYIKNLDGDAQKFILAMKSQLEQFEFAEDDFIIDLAASSAIYSSFSNDDDAIFKVGRFVTQYHKFHPNVNDRTIYAIDEGTVLAEDNPLSLLNSVAYSLSLIRNGGFGSLLLYVDKDVKYYARRLENMISDEGVDVSLALFKKSSVKVSNIYQKINVNGVDYDFDDVSVLHYSSNCLKVFSQEFSTYVSSSEHTYFISAGEKNYLIAIDPAITKCFRSLQERMKSLYSKNPPIRSFPKPTIAHAEYDQIDRWAQAVDVLQEHRGICRLNAAQLLRSWLNYIPQKFHSNLVLLIAAHEVMNYADREGFLDKVESLLASGDCIFWLKAPEDFNGTQRLIYSREEIGRNIEKFNPARIKTNPTEVTVIVDLLVSGSQAEKSLKYYLSQADVAHVKGCYIFNESDRLLLAKRLNGVLRINICCILYTTEAILLLREKISETLGHDVAIDVTHGRNIGGNAFFDTTERIGTADKLALRQFLLNEEVLEKFDRLFLRDKWVNTVSAENLGRTNLVARYQSVPKKCFWFLPAGLRADDGCRALLRIAEVKATSAPGK